MKNSDLSDFSCFIQTSDFFNLFCHQNHGKSLVKAMTDSEKKTLDELKKELAKFKKGEKIQGRSRTTPLGKLFDEVSKKLNDYQVQSDVISYLYNNLDGDPTLTDRLIKRKYVVDQILAYLEKINKLSMKKDGTNIISIPLYDIRIVGELTNIVILHGIYSIVPTGLLIPLEQRKLKNFKISTAFEKIDFNKGVPILKNILNTFTGILESNSDLKDLILVGTGFIDTLSIAVLFSVYSDDYSKYIERLEAQSSTYQLLSFYSILYKTTKTDAKFSAFVSSLLSKQLMKPNGVESLIDLVLGLREEEEIDISKINYIVQILTTSKPKDISFIIYFNNIFEQIYKMLIFVNRPLMNTILVEIIIDIYNKNKKVIVDFLFKKVWNKFNPKIDTKNENIVLTNEIDLNNAFNVCISISRCLNSTSINLTDEFFGPIIIKLWYYSNYQRKSNKDFDIVLNLIKNVIVLGDSENLVGLIISRFLEYDESWTFETGENNLTYIKYNTKESSVSKENKILNVFDKIDFNVDTFIKLVTKLNDCDSKYLNEILINVLNRLLIKSELIETEVPIQKIIYLKLIQSILEIFKAEIENSSVSLLIFANTYFNQYFDSINSKSNFEIVEDVDSDDEDDDDKEISFKNTTEVLESISPILEIIADFVPSDEDEKLQLENLQCLLKQNLPHIPKSIQYITDKILRIDLKELKVKQNSNAFDIETILKQINDSTPSIRVYAFDKLTKYTITDNNREKMKKEVSTKYTFNLLLSQLKDPEPFVYLNVIRNINLVLTYDKTFLSQIIEFYSQSKKSIDEKLRLGEILTKFVNMNGKVLTPKQTEEIVNMCINISRVDSALQEKSKDNKDTKMKMSALSILGLTCFEAGYGIVPYISEIADLIHGIITFESSPELRRVAVVIVTDIIRNEKGLEILKNYGEKLQLLLNYISDLDEDLLVCQYATNALNLIDDAFEKKLKISNSN
jgi:hypothetical protein